MSRMGSKKCALGALNLCVTVIIGDDINFRRKTLPQFHTSTKKSTFYPQISLAPSPPTLRDVERAKHIHSQI